MGVLQAEFDRVLRDELDIEAVKKSVLKRAATKKGVSLSDEETESLVTALGDETNHSPDHVVIRGCGGEIAITATDLNAAFDDFRGEMDRRVNEVIRASTEKMPGGVLDRLYEDAPRMRREHRGIARGFERRLYARWRQGLDRLKMLIVIAQEAGNAHLQDLRTRLNEPGAPATAWRIQTADAVVGLHVRACRIASEALCLLHGGHADGANARWRTLHEVATIANFLTERRGDTAARYLRHGAIGKLKSARQFQKHCTRLGYAPIATAEMQQLQREYDRAIREFGVEFETDYGWAAKAVGRTNPTFADIENSIKLNHWRPHFRMACHAVHAGSQGLFFSLGSPTGQMYAGASNAGLADPGHSTAISLTLASTALLTFEPTLDGLVTCGVMRLLTDDIGDAFLRAHEQLERETREGENPTREADLPHGQLPQERGP
jgi:hypothetical protein